MTPEVLNAIISALAVIAGTIISAVVSNQLIKYRIEQLEKKVDKHNNIIERTYQLETEIEVLENKVENLDR